MSSRRIVAGVDGCPGGWVAVVWHSGTAALEPHLGRDCDTAARRLLPRGKSASVFPAPRRYMLGLDWAAANAAGKAREGKGLSRQSANIMAKIAELDAALTPVDQERVLETHPELAFHRLNAFAPLPPKRGVQGRAVRLELLRAAGLPAPETLLERYPRREVAPDDLLDAAVCAAIARDTLAGTASRVPDGPPPRDPRDLRMEIWF